MKTQERSQRELLAEVRARIWEGDPGDPEIIKLDRKMSRWSDSTSRGGEGTWQLYTMCRGCGELRYCHGKERDRVRCFACFLENVQPVPLFELGIWGASGPEAIALGRKLLADRGKVAKEASLRNLMVAQERQRDEREARAVRIAELLDRDNYTLEMAAEEEGVSLATAKRSLTLGRSLLTSRSLQ